MKALTEKDYKRHADILITTTFTMADAIDMMLRRAIEINESYGIELDREFKHRHNRLMDYLTKAKVTLDWFNRYCDGELDWKNRDLMREDSNYLCRLILYCADRTYHDCVKEMMIEDYVKNMPEKGQLDTGYIERNFTLK